MAATSKAIVLFDNISNYEAGTTGAAVTATGSTPNTFMGDGYTLLAGANAINGFDLYPANLSGTAFSGLKLTIYVWGTVNTTGTVSAATPAFSNLLGSYTFTTSTVAGQYPTGSFFNFESATPGLTAGVTIPTLTLTGTTIGLTYNYQGTTDGTTYANVNSLTSLISYGTAPTVGSLPLSTSGTVGGYYRNANSEVNGNFTSAFRSLGGTPVPTFQGLAVRVYGTAVPEPSTWAIIVLGGVVLAWQVRRRACARLN